MKRIVMPIVILFTIAALTACGPTTYKAKPLPFKAPSAYANATDVAGALVGSRAYSDRAETTSVFGFDIIGAGMMPVQVVVDNQGPHPLKINGQQSFLEDIQGNLWPVLDRSIAYQRATKYAQTEQAFVKGAEGAFLGAVAGAIIGAAVGIVSNENVAETLGKGAAVGAAAGATMGGIEGKTSNEVNQIITADLKAKSLQNTAINPRTLAHGFLFYPGEAQGAHQLRLQLVEENTGNIHVVIMRF